MLEQLSEAGRIARESIEAGELDNSIPDPVQPEGYAGLENESSLVHTGQTTTYRELVAVDRDPVWSSLTTYWVGDLRLIDAASVQVHLQALGVRR